MLASDGATETTVKGITFENGRMTVEAGASPAVVYVRATNAEGLTARVRVNIHGLSFKFGSAVPEEGLTQVTDTAYTERLGYGFESTTGLTVSEDNVSGTESYKFKANVPNGNYVVSVETTAESMTSEIVDTVSATTGITKTGATFNVAVCDGVLDLTFPAGSTLTSLAISQAAAKQPLAKPAVYAIGDSTTDTTNNGAKSWGNCVADGDVELPDVFSSFSNRGNAGKDSVQFYNLGDLESVLLAINPGDYVTVNMGINTRVANEAASFETLIRDYYVQGIIQRGAIPVIVTATPQGPVGNYVGNYDPTTGIFNCDRGDGAKNDMLRRVAEDLDVALIELGEWGDEYFNSITLEEAQAAGYDSVLAMVQDMYIDHNHYKQSLGIKIGEFLLGELEDMVLNAPELTVTVGEITLSGNTATVPVTVENGSAPINAYVAQYADGTLVSIDAVSNAEVTGTQNIEIPFEVADGADTIKVMVWDNAQQQYCDVFSDSIEYPEA